MDKQKEIKEMAKTYCQNGFKCDDSCQTNGCRVYEVCTELYNAGYRKIPENAVVLTREGLEDMVKAKMSAINNMAIIARKETAKKFAERVVKKHGYDPLTHEGDEDIDICLTASELYEICKEITEGKV